MAHPKHEKVRERYAGRCGYCGISETDAGGELTVDHYQPLSHSGDDSDANLVYACFRCNLYKGDFYPDAAALAKGWRLLHPLLEDRSPHWVEAEDGRLIGLSLVGAFHIETLKLNRPQLVEGRRQEQARRSRQIYMLEREAIARNFENTARKLLEAARQIRERQK